MTESECYETIAAAHAAPEWACFRDVVNATGFAGSRRADALAMNLYPSRGLEIRGFEIKVSRGDLRKELATPDKAETIAQFCSTWYLVTPAGLTDKDEIPLAWGIMEIGDKGLRTKRAATPRQPDEVVPPTKLFVAALARAAHKEIDAIRKDWIPRSDITEKMEARYRAGVESAPREFKFRIETLEKRLAGARPILASLGIDVDSERWEDKLDKERGEQCSKALCLGRLLMQGYGGVEHAAQLLEDSIGAMTRVRKSLDVLIPPKEAKP